MATFADQIEIEFTERGIWIEIASWRKLRRYVVGLLAEKLHESFTWAICATRPTGRAGSRRTKVSRPHE